MGLYAPLSRIGFLVHCDQITYNFKLGKWPNEMRHSWQLRLGSLDPETIDQWP
jgi:hypothetical protein